MNEIFNKIEKYNVWSDREIQTGFKRPEYLDKISKYLDNKLVKVITGQRRVGKSYILRQIIHLLINQKKVNPKNIFYVNKEYAAFDDIKTYDDLENLYNYYYNKLRVNGKVYIFLDELQNIKEWERFVNSHAQDYTSNCEVFVTGSNSNMLSGELASLLSGRYVEINIYPFSFNEYITYNKLEINRDTFITYMNSGGLPEMFYFNDEEVKRNYVQSLRNTIILRDIVQRFKVKDITLLDEIFKFLATNIGNLTSFTSIVKYFKSKQKQTNYETISSYVKFLTDTFVLHECERYNLRGKQVLGNVRKFYINDLAFKNYLFGYYPSDIGYNLENFVYLHLKRQGYDVFVGVLGEREIDFVAQKNNNIRYLQVSYLLGDNQTYEREYGNLLALRDNYEKVVISMDENKYSDYQGIKHLRPWELMDL